MTARRLATAAGLGLVFLGGLLLGLSVSEPGYYERALRSWLQARRG